MLNIYCVFVIGWRTSWAHLSRLVMSNNNVATSLNLKGPSASAVHLSSAIYSTQQYIEKWQQLQLINSVSHT